MDYLYIVNAFKQQQQQFLLHQQQLQQQLQSQSSTTNSLSLQQQLDSSNMSNSLIWQPWRDLQQAAVHHQLYHQHQQKLLFKKETRLTSKELPTTAWRRERRLRTGEYHHPHHHPSPGSSTSSARASSPSSSPPPAAHVQHSPISSGSVSNTNTHIHTNAHQISIMMAAAAAASMRPLSESASCSAPSPPPHSTLAGQIHLGQIAHSQALQHINSVQSDDAPLDMSVGTLKQRNSPPPPYREPLPGSQFASSLARPSVITQAPPKRDVRESPLVANRENDNRSCESIDEHFRRSLGPGYHALFSKRSPANQSTKTPSPQPQNAQPPRAHVRSPSPTLPPTTGASSLPSHTVLTQLELNPPPAYPTSLPTDNHQQNSQHAHQNQVHVAPKSNSVLLSPAAIATQIKVSTRPNSPPLPLVVRPCGQPKQQQAISLQKSSSLIAITPLTSPHSPAPIPGVKLGNTTQTPIFNAVGSRTASPLPLHQHQQQLSAVGVALSHFASIDNSPSSSPRRSPPAMNVPVSNPSPNLPAIMRIKTEPGLQNVKSHNPTPPASPTSTTNHNVSSNSTTYSSNTSSPSPSSPITSSWKSTNTGNASAEVLASVDDHFAKALGDTWKKLQESKEVRK
ncbi:flocculation protein FLO11 isoform X1 [Lucilia sericata]|uniref:flocculation protein FLO11 isoform X1 n=1 Tax=Lucilia sericata TaxID=13632 RepID=UPI0018A84AF5|nr:flocculation protein FLO11 isoform X1 [Lucilia sericata]XP_037807738.1 flocculation protein FLO11 isoform X1 [Lucilia sericata]XP_037807739.1 flocculation protein FLO11 isoform X1 [Lucilia sericata]XP_037807740.1 flocculation protein FLO11 isoform X1 [Lucilia sericata]